MFWKKKREDHSITVDLDLVPVEAPDVLFHGTSEKNLKSIMGKGLIKGKRHHVHLSKDEETALKVGRRHGKPVVLQVNSEDMQRQGHYFYLSENRVWLTDHVPPDYITLPQRDEI